MTCVLAVTAAIGFGQSEHPPTPSEPMPAAPRDYPPVTAERLKSGGAIGSPSAAPTMAGATARSIITADNVKGLRPVWIFFDREPKVHEAAPLVNNASCSFPRRTIR